MKKPICPCEPNCPDRGEACQLTCQRGFAQYMAERNAQYEERARAKAAAMDASAGIQKASRRLARYNHGKKYS